MIHNIIGGRGGNYMMFRKIKNDLQREIIIDYEKSDTTNCLKM